MLVMTTIFTATMEKLPSTAYIKMVDLWLLFGQITPFIEVLLQTIMERQRQRDGNGNRIINHHGRERKVSVSSPPTSPSIQVSVSPSPTNVDTSVSPVEVTHSVCIISVCQEIQGVVTEAFVESPTSQGEIIDDDDIQVIRVIKYIGE